MSNAKSNSELNLSMPQNLPKHSNLLNIKFLSKWIKVAVTSIKAIVIDYYLVYNTPDNISVLLSIRLYSTMFINKNL